MDDLSLDEFLESRGGGLAALPDAVGLLNDVRDREARLRRWLPHSIVRRLDSGFARSNTVHPDSARALYAAVRALRPAHVFETGTYWGYSAAYLATGVRDNGAGRVWTFDVDPKAGRHLPAGLRPHVELVVGRPATEAMPGVLERHPPDLFFQDSRHDYEGVAGELSVALPHLRGGAVVLLHDFVADQVRAAAVDVLGGGGGFEVRRLAGADPQQLGIAWRP